MNISSYDVKILLGDLIAIHSPYFEEKRIMDYVYEWLTKQGIPAQFHHYHENKITNFKGVNVIGEIQGNSGPSILINSHLDTVHICEGWTTDPLKAEVIGNKMYGLGALDMKSGVAAAMLALKAFKKNVKSFNGKVVYNFVSDEEGPYGLGTNAILEDGLLEDISVAIVPEPSSGFTSESFPCLCLGARGGYSYTVEVSGRSAHAANPDQGICAIEAASKIMLALKSLNLTYDEHLGKGDICIVDFNGGGAACSVADKASFRVFRHIVNGEDKETLRAEVATAAKLADVNVPYTVDFRESPSAGSDGFMPYKVSYDNKYTQKMIQSIERVTELHPNISYFQSIGDFNYIGSRLNIPTFVFGPGGSNYHSADEFVYLNDVVETAKVIYDYLVTVLEASV